jgi:hypothetical protein
MHGTAQYDRIFGGDPAHAVYPPSLSPIAHHRAGLPNITQREAPVGMRPIIIPHYPTYASHESRRAVRESCMPLQSLENYFDNPPPSSS